MASFTVSASSTRCPVVRCAGGQSAAGKAVKAAPRTEATTLGRRGLLASAGALIAFAGQEKAALAEGACKADPYGSDKYRADTKELNLQMMRLVSGESEKAGTVHEDAVKYQELWKAWDEYTKPNCNRSTCFTEVHKRGQNVNDMINLCRSVDDSKCKGDYDYTYNVFNKDYYLKNMEKVDNVFSNGLKCNGMDAYK